MSEIMISPANGTHLRIIRRKSSVPRMIDTKLSFQHFDCVAQVLTLNLFPPFKEVLEIFGV